MGGPADGNPHRIETRRLDLREIVLLERHAPRAFLRRLEHVAQVDAPPERRLQGLEERIGGEFLRQPAVVRRDSHAARVSAPSTARESFAARTRRLRVAFMGSTI